MKEKQLFRGGNVSAIKLTRVHARAHTHAKSLSIFFVNLHKLILPRRCAVENSQRAALRLAVTQPWERHAAWLLKILFNFFFTSVSITQPMWWTLNKPWHGTAGGIGVKPGWLLLVPERKEKPSWRCFQERQWNRLKKITWFDTFLAKRMCNFFQNHTSMLFLSICQALCGHRGLIFFSSRFQL